MKKLILATTIFMAVLGQTSAQQNPAISSPQLTPTLLAGLGSQFDLSFQVGNSGTVNISGADLTQQMGFTVSLGKCAPSVGGAVSATGTNALSGDALAYFDVTYNASTNVFSATQKANIAMGAVPSGMHSLTIHVQVTTLSASTTVNDIGATVNIQPNLASIAAGQQTNDDNVFMFTHTNASLPVTLTRFDARVSGCMVNLNWQTAGEQHFDHFEIERSTGKSFQRMVTVAAKGENSTYAFTDEQPAAGVNLYRLKMVDHDTKATYSEIAKVSADCPAGPGIMVYPNPASGLLHVKGLKEGSTLRLMDMAGRMLLERKSSKSLETLDLSGFSSALYTLQVIVNGTVTDVIKVNSKK